MTVYVIVYNGDGYNEIITAFSTLAKARAFIADTSSPEDWFIEGVDVE